MSILFSNAVIWPVAALVAVPLLLHLFARTKPPVYSFSSVEFILRIIRSTLRMKRPQDWLLLALRTLLFTSLVLVFLRPLFFSQRRLAGMFQAKNVVVIVDATASMSYVDGAQTRFAAACAEASEIMAGLSNRDTANVVWLSSAPRAVFPEMGANIAYLRDSLRRASVTSEAGNIQEAFDLAVRLLSEAEGKRELCIISDFQKTAWEDVSLTPIEGLDIVKVPVGTATAANAALTDIQFRPARPLLGEEVTIFCDVHNYSAQPCGRTLFLEAGESRRSQQVVVPPWSKATGVFRHTFKSPGTFTISAALDEDVFPGDDRRWTCVPVLEFMRTGILASDTQTAGAWRRALDALGWARTETISRADLDGDLPYDILMLAGWDGASRQNLREKLLQGATIVCSPAGGVSPGDATLSRRQADVGALLRHEQSSEPHSVKIVRPDDRIFQLFADGDFGDPSRGLFRERLHLARNALSGADVLMAFDDGVPALARLEQNGSLYFWNLALDPEFSNWASHVEFLPFLAELLLGSRPSANGHVVYTEHLPGEPVAWNVGRTVLTSDMQLRDRIGQALPIRRGGGSLRFASSIPPPLGSYEWLYRGQYIGCSVVNFPTIESDLRPMDREQVKTAGSVVAAGGSKVRHLRDGVKLWPYFLALALCLGLLEGLALIWIERT